jgi:hypothetical protein
MGFATLFRAARSHDVNDSQPKGGGLVIQSGQMRKGKLQETIHRGRTTRFAREPGLGVLISVLAVEQPLISIASQTPNHA